MTAEKDPEPPAYQRPKTAGVATAKESLWSAGGQNQRAGSGSRFKAEDDLDGLDEDEDEIGSALNQNFSGNKSHQRSNDQLMEKRRALFGGANGGSRTNSASGL